MQAGAPLADVQSLIDSKNQQFAFEPMDTSALLGVSGAGTIGAPGTAGLGQTIGGVLEMSNVDLATEFTNMITAQRGFEASSRVLSTADEMLQNLVNRYGAEHVVLGTDYPFDMGVDDPVGFVQQAKLSALDKARIMGGNAARLLKIDYNRSRRSKS